jgi:hypothetical protein
MSAAPPNKLELQVFSMMRSGHHAVISWLLDSAGGNCYFRNDLLEAEEIGKAGAHEIRGDISKQLDCYIVNIEDTPIKKTRILANRNRKILSFRTSNKVVGVAVVRNPFNLFASRLQWVINYAKKRDRYDAMLLNGENFGDKRANYIGNVGWANKSAVKMWSDYGVSMLNKQSLVGGGHKTVYINYDKWLVDNTYRGAILSSIGLEGRASIGKQVAKYGGGSSFSSNQSVDIDGILNRWINFVDNEEYISLFKNNHAFIKTYKSIFGNVNNLLLNKIIV